MQNPHHWPAADEQDTVGFNVCHSYSVLVNVALMRIKEVNSERREGVGAVERKKRREHL